MCVWGGGGEEICIWIELMCTALQIWSGDFPVSLYLHCTRIEHSTLISLSFQYLTTFRLKKVNDCSEASWESDSQ